MKRRTFLALVIPVVATACVGLSGRGGTPSPTEGIQSLERRSVVFHRRAHLRAIEHHRRAVERHRAFHRRMVEKARERRRERQARARRRRRNRR